MNKIITVILLSISLFGLNAYAAPEDGVSLAPEIILPTKDARMQLSKLKGNVVYLDFWASWCVPCKKSFPWMSAMQKKYADQGLMIVAVNLDKDRAQADEFIHQMNDKVDMNFTVAFDASGESAKKYKLRGMPSSYLIGRDGKVYASHIGFREKDKDKLEQAILSLLKK